MYQSREELLTAVELKEALKVVRTSQLGVRKTPCILAANTSVDKLDNERW
jgi:hypothetical protein